MEYPFDPPVKAGVVGHLGAEPPSGTELASHYPREAGEPDGEDFSPIFKGVLEDTALGPLEEN